MAMIWVDRYLWPTLIVLAVVFATGISGTWLSGQLYGTPFFWGYLGAVLMGGAVFGGIRTYVGGKRLRGAAIALAGGIAAIIVDVQYFRYAHELALAIPLGLYPTLIAVLAGVVEAEQVERVSRVVEEKELREQAWELDQRAKENAHKRRLETLRTKAELPVERAEHKENGFEHVLNTPKWITDNLKRSFAVFVQDNPLAGYREIVQNVGLSSTSGVKPLAEACGYKKNGVGWERVN